MDSVSPYFVRVLGRDPKCVPVLIAQEALAQCELRFELSAWPAGGADWSELELCNASGRTVA
jgi:hypothetical protein